MMPEQIVADEDMVPDRRQVAADRIDGPFPYGARVQLPDRAERAAEGTAAGRLDEPRGPVRQARVLTAPARRRRLSRARASPRCLPDRGAPCAPGRRAIG